MLTIIVALVFLVAYGIGVFFLGVSIGEDRRECKEATQTVRNVIRDKRMKIR